MRNPGNNLIIVAKPRQIAPAVSRPLAIRKYAPIINTLRTIDS